LSAACRNWKRRVQYFLEEESHNAEDNPARHRFQHRRKAWKDQRKREKALLKKKNLSSMNVFPQEKEGRGVVSFRRKGEENKRKSYREKETTNQHKKPRRETVSLFLRGKGKAPSRMGRGRNWSSLLRRRPHVGKGGVTENQKNRRSGTKKYQARKRKERE